MLSSSNPNHSSSLSQEAEVLYKSYSTLKSNTWISLISSGKLGLLLSWSLVSTIPKDAKLYPSSVNIAVWEGLIRSIERTATDIPNGVTIIPSLLQAVLLLAVPICSIKKIDSIIKNLVHGLHFLQSCIQKDEKIIEKRVVKAIFAEPFLDIIPLQVRSSLRDLVNFSEQLLERISYTVKNNDRKLNPFSDPIGWCTITKITLQAITRACRKISHDILSYKNPIDEKNKEELDNEEGDIEEEEVKDTVLSSSGIVVKNDKNDNNVSTIHGDKNISSNSMQALSASAKKRLKKKLKKNQSLTLTNNAIASNILLPIKTSIQPTPTLLYFAIGLSSSLNHNSTFFLQGEGNQNGNGTNKEEIFTHLDFPLDLFYIDMIEDAIIAQEQDESFTTTNTTFHTNISSVVAELCIGWAQYASLMIVSNSIVKVHTFNSSKDDHSCIVTAKSPSFSLSSSKNLSLAETSFNAAIYRLCLSLKRMTSAFSSTHNTIRLYDLSNSSLLFQDLFEKKNLELILDVIFKPILNTIESEKALYDLMQKEGGVEIKQGESKQAQDKIEVSMSTTILLSNSTSEEEDGFLEDIPNYYNEGLLSEKDQTWIENIAARVEPQVRSSPLNPLTVLSYTLVAIELAERLAHFNDGVKAELASHCFSRIYRFCIESVLLPLHISSLVTGGTGPRALLPSSTGKAIITANSATLKNVLSHWQHHESERGASLIDEDLPNWLLYDLQVKDGAEAADGVRAIYWAAAVAIVSGPLRYIRAKKLQSLLSISNAVNGGNNNKDKNDEKLLSKPPHLMPPLPPSPKKGLDGKVMSMKALGASAMIPQDMSLIIVTRQELDRIARLELNKSVQKGDISKLSDPLPIPIPEEEEEIDY